MTQASDGVRSGQNKMVWVSSPKAKKLPVIDGTLNLEQGEWDSASAIYGMLDPRPGRLLPLDALTRLPQGAATRKALRLVLASGAR